MNKLTVLIVMISVFKYSKQGQCDKIFGMVAKDADGIPTENTTNVICGLAADTNYLFLVETLENPTRCCVNSLQFDQYCNNADYAGKVKVIVPCQKILRII